jgi:transcriptional regulator with XRE-family HTH domain
MNIAKNKQIFAANLQRYMDSFGITKQRLCDDLDIKYPTLVDWLKARTYPRIGAVEKLAYYFGCEKADLIEDSMKKDADDGLSDSQRALIMFAQTVPKEKADIILRVAKSILEDD